MCCWGLSKVYFKFLSKLLDKNLKYALDNPHLGKNLKCALDNPNKHHLFQLNGNDL